MERKKFFIGKKSAYNNFIIWRVRSTYLPNENKQ